MILCINLNAAIDKTVVVDEFQRDQIHRPDEVLAAPGGKGINVARALKILGEDPFVFGWVGGYAGRFIDEGLKGEGIRAAFIQVPGESRTCLSIVDRSRGRLTEIYEQGSPIPVSAQEAFLETFLSWLPSCSLVALSGSLPPGVPPDFYVKLISLASQTGIPALLDTSGEPLKLGFELGKPFLVKPNREELVTLVKRKHRTIQGFFRAATELSDRSGGIVAISVGKDGLVIASPEGAWHASPPEINIRSAVGSGDALLAGLAYGFLHQLPFENTIKMAVAAGTANAMSLGAGRFDFKEYTSIVQQVRVAKLS